MGSFGRNRVAVWPVEALRTRSAQGMATPRRLSTPKELTWWEPGSDAVAWAMGTPEAR